MLLFADGFDAYGATADLTKKWGFNPTPANITWGATNGRFGGAGLQLVTSGTLTTPSFTPNQVAGHAGIAGWWQFSAKPTGVLQFLTIGNGVVGIALNTLGQITAYSGGAGTSIGPNICDTQWHWLEILILSSLVNTAQTWSVWIDGTQYANNVTANIGANTTGGFQQFSLLSVSGVTTKVDDLILVDDQAGSQTGELVANSVFPLGPKKCETMWPNGAGTNTNWSPLSGANYTNVDENPTDWDTTYVQASSSGIRDSYAFPGSISGVNPLVAVVNVVAKNADAGSINIQGLTYSGSSYGLGDSKLAGSAYANLQFPIFRDPNTGAAWTKAGVNAAQFGVGVV